VWLGQDSCHKSLLGFEGGTVGNKSLSQFWLSFAILADTKVFSTQPLFYANKKIKKVM